MEVKINKEIRNYTESMFFWIVPAAVHFFFACLRRSGGTVLYSPSVFRNRNAELGVYSRRCALCGNGLCQVQRYDRRAICMGVD